MKKLFIQNKIKYDGSQLRPLFAYENFNLMGHSIIAWIGECDVQLDHMVDLEDKIVNSKICGKQMLHFIVEVFDSSLREMVALQRLFSSMVKDEIFLLCPSQPLVREGDDLYLESSAGRKKLSISIASKSAVSGMIHFAINISNEGTPVPTLSLSDLNISDVQSLSEKILEKFTQEFETIQQATMKVKPLS